MPNVFEPDFELKDDPDGFRGREARISVQAGAERIGACLYEVDPGQRTYPYHWHAANEEILIVLRGAPTLRTPEGERELSAGDVVSFPRGEAGAHAVINRTEDPIRVLILSEMNGPEVAVYPDSGKVLARQQAPGKPAEGVRAIFRVSDQVDYWEGELGRRDDD